MSDHSDMTHDGAAHAHPPYMKIFGYLIALTVVEVAVPFLLTASKEIALTILIVIAIVKILLIARYFMHLKFDARILGFIAVTPAVLASIMALGLLMDNWG